jgi:hypothetical protein
MEEDGRPFKRLIDEAETGLLRPNSLRIIINIITIVRNKGHCLNAES